MTSSMTLPTWLPEILEENSFLKFHAYYKGIRHSHKTQGIIALARLGASKEFVEKFLKATESLIKPILDSENDIMEEPLEADYLQSEKLEDYRGKNQGFYKMLSMYKELYNTKYQNNIVSMVKDVCPTIIDGPTFNSFHGIIQLAYGLAGDSYEAVIEGITIMDQQYSPLFIDDEENNKRNDLQPFGKGSRNILDVFGELKGSNIVCQLKQENDKELQKRKNINMYGAYGWSAVKHHSDFFMDLANSIKLPEWFIPYEKDISQLRKLTGWLMDKATMIYVKNNLPNEFFILHGITSCWSALQVLPLLEFDSGLLGLRGILSALLIMYVIQGAPGLDKKLEDYYVGPVDQDAWDKLIHDVLHADKIFEFHVYKVVQCLYERWQENLNGDDVAYYFAAAKIIHTSFYSLGTYGVRVPNFLRKLS